LLSGREARIRGVVGPDDQGILGVPRDGIGDVELERRVAPLVVTDLSPVDPDVRPPVDRPEPQPDALILRELGGHAEPAAIPPDPRGPFRLMDAGELTLPGEGYDDRAVESLGFGLLPAGLEALVPGIEAELPRSIQVGPGRPHRIGPGMLGLRASAAA